MDKEERKEWKRQADAEDKIRRILAKAKLTPFQRLWLKYNKPDIYKYLPCPMPYGKIEGGDLISFNETYTIPDAVTNYIEEVGDTFSTRFIDQISNWTLSRRKIARGEYYRG